MSGNGALGRLVEAAAREYSSEERKVGESEALGRLLVEWAGADSAKLLGALMSALEAAGMEDLREQLRQLVLENGIGEVKPVSREF